MFLLHGVFHGNHAGCSHVGDFRHSYFYQKQRLENILLHVFVQCPQSDMRRDLCGDALMDLSMEVDCHGRDDS